MKRKITVVFTIAGLLICSILYSVLQPTYKFTYYKLKSCSNLYLTKIEYWKIGESGVAFTTGKYSGKSLPLNEVFINRNVDGFDSMYNVVATCSDGKIVINYNSGYYRPIGITKMIFEKRVKAAEFDSLLNNLNNLHILGY